MICTPSSSPLSFLKIILTKPSASPSASALEFPLKYALTEENSKFYNLLNSFAADSVSPT